LLKEALMADALFTQLSSIIKPSTMTDIATKLGVPEQSVGRGLALSGATAFAGLANKAGDSDAMRQFIDIASKTPADAIASGVSGGQLTDPTSPLMSTGRRVLSSLFGGGTSGLADVIGREAGRVWHHVDRHVARRKRAVESHRQTRAR
jgi:hypothetical protein